VITPPIADQLLVDLIQNEKPLQVSTSGHTLKTPVPRDLRISQKFQRHAAQTVDLPAIPTDKIPTKSEEYRLLNQRSLPVSTPV
jgi:hypothetical protein